MRKISTPGRLTRGLIVLALSVTLLGVGTKALAFCGTIDVERACEADAKAEWNKAVEGLSWYSPTRLYYAIVYTDRINQCYAPCGGSIL